jgi:uncharacterized damage-inducible protein DinB
LRGLAWLFCSLFFGLGALAQVPEKPAEKSNIAVMAPTAGPRFEFLDELSFYEQRFERLAEAIPAEKYNWRPVEGVRTVGDVYMHVVSSNYNAARMLGTPYPAGIDPKAMMAYASDKPKVLQALKDSFAQIRTAILAVKDSDLSKEIKTPHGPTSILGSFFMISGQYGEHLGQSIVYSRLVGVVPPWTEERQRQQEVEKPKP